MTTARERMIALSGLAGAHTAREHFLAIMQGTGPGQTIFASMFAVQIDEPRLTLVQRPKREAGEDYRPAISRLSADTEKAIAIFTREAALSVRTEIDELFIWQGSTNTVVVRELGNEQLTVRQSDVLEMN